MEKKKNPSAFIRNTYSILQRPDLDHIIAWNHDGNGFIIHDLAQFEAQILPQYFKHQKYTSFVRQQVRTCSSFVGTYCSQICMASISRGIPILITIFSMSHSVGGRISLSEIKRKPERKKKNEDENSMNQFQIQQNELKCSTIEQRSENALSEQDPNPQSIHKPSDDAIEQNNKIYGCSFGSLCEQAILQNQILVKIHPILTSYEIKLKELRLRELRQQAEDTGNVNDLMISMCEIIKAQTMKLSSVFDLPHQ